MRENTLRRHHVWVFFPKKDKKREDPLGPRANPT